MQRTIAGHVVEKGSLEARARRDPELRQRIERGRKKFYTDQKVLERWAARGFRAS